MRMRREGRKRKKPGQEKCWKNEATTDPRSTDPQIHQPNNGNQERCTTRRNRERYDLWCNADEPRNKNCYTPLQSTARREDCKDKDPTKVTNLEVRTAAIA